MRSLATTLNAVGLFSLIVFSLGGLTKFESPPSLLESSQINVEEFSDEFEIHGVVAAEVLQDGPFVGSRHTLTPWAGTSPELS